MDTTAAPRKDSIPPAADKEINQENVNRRCRSTGKTGNNGRHNWNHIQNEIKAWPQSDPKSPDFRWTDAWEDGHYVIESSLF